MNKVLDAFWRPSSENREIVFKDVTFENTMRGLNILYGNCGGSYEMDVCINGEVVAVAALTGIASYRTNETVHVCIPEIQPGTYTISFRTNQYPIIFKFIFTETTYFENVGHYEVPDYNFKETDNDLITATDELGRKLPNSDQCGPVKKRQVGLFYWTWRNQDVSWEPTSLEKILREHPEAEYDINHSAWKSIERLHWTEPFYGFYRNDDPYVIRKHAQYFANAGVDVLFFDNTNGSLMWKDAYMALLEEFHKARLDGIKTPQVTFIMNFGPLKTTLEMLRSAYQDLYKPGKYKDLWYMWDGKPLVLAYPEAIPTEGKSEFDTELLNEIRNFFTFRPPQPLYAGGPQRKDHWGWLEIAPQNGYVLQDDGRYEMCTVGVAQNANSERICTRFNDKDTYGRSYTYKDKHGKVTKDSYKYGYNVQEQWDNALKIDPDMVFITGWNEWIMVKLLGKPWVLDENSTQVAFVDQYDHEHSRDIEPDCNGYKDSFYLQMVSNIRKYKGLKHIERENVNKKINIYDFSSWKDVLPEYPSHKGTAANRDYPGLGEYKYVNKSGINNFISAKYAYDENNVYFYVKCAENIVLGHKNAMTLLLDTDRDKSTGWEGYDYKIIDGKCFNILNGSLKYCGEIKYNVDNNEMAVELPKALFGIEKESKPDFEFKWIDNVDTADIMEFYRDGDCAPFGRFNYVM